MNGHRLTVERAAEPLDVFWENLGYSTLNRLMRGFITYFITFCSLLLVFGINLGLQMLKIFLEDKGKDEENQTPALLWSIRAVTAVTSVLVVVMNMVLSRVVRFLTTKEKHATYTKYHLSISFKLVAAMFSNTVLIPLAVNPDRGAWFTSSGLVVDTFYNAISVAFLTPLFYLFNVGYIVKRVR